MAGPANILRRILFPNDIPNLVQWIDAADVATITESAGDVSQIDDKSGTGNHAAQGTGLNQPGTGNNTQNGLNVLDFDGVDHQLIVSSPPSTTDWTIFIAAEPQSTLGTGQWWTGNGLYDAEVGGTTTDWGLSIGNTPAANLKFGTGQSDSTISSTTDLLNTWAVMGVTRLNSTGEKHVFVSNTSEATQTTNSGARLGTRVTIGSIQTNQFYLQMDLGEICVWDRVLTQDEIDRVVLYLEGKWRI